MESKIGYQPLLLGYDTWNLVFIATRIVLESIFALTLNLSPEKPLKHQLYRSAYSICIWKGNISSVAYIFPGRFVVMLSFDRPVYKKPPMLHITNVHTNICTEHHCVTSWRKWVPLLEGRSNSSHCSLLAEISFQNFRLAILYVFEISEYNVEHHNRMVLNYAALIHSYNLILAEIQISPLCCIS